MSAYEDEDGIDGPFNRAMDRAMKEDAKGVTPAKPQDPAPTPLGHDMPWHTEACFQASGVVECRGDRDRRRCNVCGKEWEEACNFDDEYS